VSSESHSSDSFDLAAAGLRADGADVASSIDVLAGKLEGALPGYTRVERHGRGLLGREKRVRAIVVELGPSCYRLTLEGERLQGFRERTVGGISIKREPYEAEAWVRALEADLREQAEHSAQAREALGRLLGL
jgi:hypothetical protein